MMEEHLKELRKLYSNFLSKQYKQMSCDPGTTNPFCLENKPTDPYSWINVGAVRSEKEWSYAYLFDATKTYVLGDAVTYELEAYVCTNSIGCPAAAEPDLPNWTLAENTFSRDFSSFVTGNCSTNQAPPNVQTGMCETSPAKGLGAECVNPCMRLQNGKLAVTRDTGSCRIFSTATSGGIQILNPLESSRCGTVCPNACVELWETCPPGSAPITTLLQTKSSLDLLSLTGPYLQNGSINPLWPINYAYKDSTGNAIIGKPYTECYSFNTSYCQLPGARQESVANTTNPTNGLVIVQGATSCFASCPVGTFQSLQDSKLCLYSPLNAADLPTYGPLTNVQPVFCNPQYFNPAYWLEDALIEPSGPRRDEAFAKAGVQMGCRAIPLPSQLLKTCPLGSSPVINEFFNLEWCVPDCPTGYFFDLSQSNCVASCNGTSTVNNYSDPAVASYLDYVDYYVTSNRCQPDNIDCNYNNVPGMCLALNTTKKLNSTQQNGSCPAGMSSGSLTREENPNFCYDTCMPGYETTSSCPNLSQSCSPNERIYICRAKCPETSEGLGPWKTIDNGSVHTCAYNYPGPVPSDPNLWVPCPSDGRYEILSYLPTNVAISVATAFRMEPLCIRKTYLRNVTCPIGYNLQGTSCVQACDSEDLVVTLPDGNVVCQSPSTSQNHDTDWGAISDSQNALPNQKNKVLVRHVQSRGVGSDPQQPPEPVPKLQNKYTLYIVIGVILVSLFVLIMIVRGLLR